MMKKAGLWIDHRKAVLVLLDDSRVKVKTLESEVEPRLRLAGGARSKTPYGPQDIASEGNRDRRIQHELQRWYQTVIEQLGEVASLLVIGPGEAKQEFAAEFVRKPAHRHIPVSIETADKMNEMQIVAHVRSHHWRLPETV
jgi:hypothetical protein